MNIDKLRFFTGIKCACQHNYELYYRCECAQKILVTSAFPKNAEKSVYNIYTYEGSIVQITQYHLTLVFYLNKKRQKNHLMPRRFIIVITLDLACDSSKLVCIADTNLRQILRYALSMSVTKMPWALRRVKTTSNNTSEAANCRARARARVMYNVKSNWYTTLSTRAHYCARQPLLRIQDAAETVRGTYEWDFLHAKNTRYAPTHPHVASPVAGVDPDC